MRSGPRGGDSKVSEYRVGVAAVIRRGATVLLGRRLREDENEGRWVFPGGGIDDDLPEDALRRECLEEVGMDVVVGDIITLTRSPHSGRFDVAAIYWATPANDGDQPSATEEIGEPAFFTVEEAHALPLMDATRDVLDKIRSQLAPEPELVSRTTSHQLWLLSVVGHEGAADGCRPEMVTPWPPFIPLAGKVPCVCGRGTWLLAGVLDASEALRGPELDPQTERTVIERLVEECDRRGLGSGAPDRSPVLLLETLLGHLGQLGDAGLEAGGPGVPVRLEVSEWVRTVGLLDSRARQRAPLGAGDSDIADRIAAQLPADTPTSLRCWRDVDRGAWREAGGGPKGDARSMTPEADGRPQP
jgi:8-oxo-dGTP diphosphatase